MLSRSKEDTDQEGKDKSEVKASGATRDAVASQNG